MDYKCGVSFGVFFWQQRFDKRVIISKEQRYCIEAISLHIIHQDDANDDEPPSHRNIHTSVKASKKSSSTNILIAIKSGPGCWKH